jgi:uncharacterized membrane protein
MAGLRVFLGLCVLASVGVLSSAVRVKSEAPPEPACPNVRRVVPSNSSAQHKYTYKNLQNVAYVVNDNGVLLAGHSSAFYLWGTPYTKSTLTNLNSTLPPDAVPVGLNNKKDLCGLTNMGSGFTYINGKFQSFTHPNDTLSSTTLAGINDNLQAVGTYKFLASGKVVTASFLLDARSKKFTPISSNGGAWYKVAGINNNGTIVGIVRCKGSADPVAFVKRNGVFTYFTVGSGIEVTSISNSGAIVGSVYGGRLYFVIPFLNLTGAFYFKSDYFPLSINAAGVVAGYRSSAAEPGFIAYPA